MKKYVTLFAVCIFTVFSLFGQNNFIEIGSIFENVTDEKDVQILKENFPEEVNNVINLDTVNDFITLSGTQNSYLIYANKDKVKLLFRYWDLAFYTCNESQIEVNGMKLTKVLICGKNYNGIGKGLFAYMNLDKDFQAAHTYVFASDRVYTIFDGNGKPYLITQYNKSLYIVSQTDLSIEHAMMYAFGYKAYVVYLDKVNKEIMCLNMTTGACVSIYSAKEYENPKLMWGVAESDYKKYKDYMFTNPETDNYVKSDFSVESKDRIIRGADGSIFINAMYLVDLDSNRKIKDNVINLHRYVK